MLNTDVADTVGFQPSSHFLVFWSDNVPSLRIYTITTLWLPRCPFWWASDPVLAKWDVGRRQLRVFWERVSSSMEKVLWGKPCLTPHSFFLPGTLHLSLLGGFFHLFIRAMQLSKFLNVSVSSCLFAWVDALNLF